MTWAELEKIEAFLKEMGYQAEAPYSGTEYDLLTGKMTVYTDGVAILGMAGGLGAELTELFQVL